MPSYYDDNFGHWEIRDEDDREHYFNVQRTNVLKKCEGCGRKVKLQPQYGFCNSCAEKRENGWEY